jgi:hypothetical protein
VRVCVSVLHAFVLEWVCMREKERENCLDLSSAAVECVCVCVCVCAIESVFM